MENFTGGIFLLETLKPEEEEIETIEQSMQVNMSFESDSDFVNQFFQLLDSSPLKLIELGYLTKLTLISLEIIYLNVMLYLWFSRQKLSQNMH